MTQSMIHNKGYYARLSGAACEAPTKREADRAAWEQGWRAANSEMQTCKFKTYKGAAGPTEAQVKSNTLWVAQVLSQLGIEHKVVPIKSTPSGKHMVIDDDAVTVRVGRYYIDYDRWGFLVTRGSELVHDQVSDKVLLEWVHKRFVR